MSRGKDRGITRRAATMKRAESWVVRKEHRNNWEGK